MKSIVLNAEMTRAVLDGRKTQTRIPIKIKNKTTRDWAIGSGVEWFKKINEGKYEYTIRERDGCWAEYTKNDLIKKYSLYQTDDILWAREPAKVLEYTSVGNYGGSWNDSDSITYEYLADGEIKILLEIPERFKTVPKWITNKQGIPNGCIKEMARIFLRVADVRVERLRDIEIKDIKAEGYSGIDRYEEICKWWIDLWNSTAKDGYKWEDNPYVFVYTFERIEKP